MVFCEHGSQPVSAWESHGDAALVRTFPPSQTAHHLCAMGSAGEDGGCEGSASPTVKMGRIGGHGEGRRLVEGSFPYLGRTMGDNEADNGSEMWPIILRWATPSSRGGGLVCAGRGGTKCRRFTSQLIDDPLYFGQHIWHVKEYMQVVS